MLLYVIYALGIIILIAYYYFQLSALFFLSVLPIFFSNGFISWLVCSIISLTPPVYIWSKLSDYLNSEALKLRTEGELASVDIWILMLVSGVVNDLHMYLFCSIACVVIGAVKAFLEAAEDRRNID